MGARPQPGLWQWSQRRPLGQINKNGYAAISQQHRPHAGQQQRSEGETRVNYFIIVILLFVIV